MTRRRRRRELQARHGRQHHPDARRARRGAGLRLLAPTRCRARRERDRGYWRDVGTLDAFYDAHMDLISVHPIFNLYNHEWPILTWPDPLPPAKFVFDEDGAPRAGARLDGLRRRRHLRRRPCGARCSRRACTCTPTPRSRTRVAHAGRRRRPRARSCAARSSTRTCTIAPGAQIGVDPEADRERFTVSDGRDRRDRQGRDGGGVKVALLTREYPPDVYGGAGVHVEYLARELRALERRRRARVGRRPRRAPPATTAWDALAGDAPHLAALRAMSIDLTMAGGRRGRGPRAHATPGTRTSAGTWPSSSTTSRTSRPCTRSSRCARGRPSSSAAATRCRASASGRRSRRADAVIAVSEGMRARHPRAPTRRSTRTACTVIYNGIDTEEYAPDPGTDVLERHGVDPARPSVVFVGRITRQKGVAAPARGGARRSTPRRSSCCARARRTRRRSAPRSRAASSELQAAARQRDLDRGDAPQARRDPAPQPRDGVRVPVDLRAARDRQPRGDGLRGGRRGHGHRRHRRGRRRRRDRPARARSSRATTPPASRATRRLRRRVRRGRQRAGRATRRAPRRWAAPAARGRSSASPGRRSRSRRWRCTSGCSERQRANSPR